MLALRRGRHDLSWSAVRGATRKALRAPGGLAFLVIGALFTAPSAGGAEASGPVAGDLQVSGQSAPSAPPVVASTPEPPRAFDGPPAPVPPEVVSRDPQGRMTIRAVRLTAPLRIDGYQIAIPNPGATGNSLQRNFEVRGSELILTFPPSTLNGQQVRNVIHLKRLGGLIDMWPEFRR